MTRTPQDIIMRPEAKFLVVRSVGLVLICLLTIPAARSWIKRGRLRNRQSEYQSLHGVYCDRDGSATQESVNAYSDKVQRWFIALLSVSGLLVSLAAAVFQTMTFDTVEVIVGYWLQFSLWVLLCTQCTALFVDPWPTKRFRLGIFYAASCAVLIGTIFLKSVPGSDYLDYLPEHVPGNLVAKAQLIIALLGGIISLLIPRRPDVFRNGKVVDGQFTVSFLSRLSFSWADSLLGYVIKNRGLDITELPELDYATRSKTLRESFDKTRKDGQRLWRTLMHEYASALFLQFVLVIFDAVLSFAPQYCLFGILRTMEDRNSGPAQSWIWVIALGASILVYSTIESWLFWVVYYRLGIPVYEQLSAVVFAKSMRRKDVKGPQKAEVENTPESPTEQPSSEEDLEEAEAKTRQGTINLIAVDAERVSEFAAFNYIIISVILKLSIAFAFLGRLIGWKSLCSGLLVAVVVAPINVFAANRYTTAQNDLMKFRDQKLEVVTEVLQGIRQIKFSAMENKWERKIWDVRNAELQTLWTSFKYDFCLIAIWILGPVMLSAVALGVYSLLYGELSASVAFTTMSIFASIEFSLAILPELIADFVDAWVSMGRIEKHLESAERGENTVPGDSITFEKATVAWPADDLDENEERFTLQDLNLQFPRGGLSVISGRTGSGKSLLLASILGEVEILEGTVRVPVPPAIEDRFDDRAHKGNWIIDSAIAYVAQVPWIENASIKDNILFGLPFDEDRYKKTLFACALEKDLEMLPDGELTDIGANGINLSGGQKWRVSFARSLYSRAGILVLDDLFSALDAHTGRHLHVHALMGELCQGRTRILVTHHVGLCLPQTEYSVLLENGTVRHAGSVEELRRTGSLKDILAQEEQDRQAKGKNEHSQAKGTVGDSLDEEGDNSLERILSHGSHVSRHEREVVAADPTPRSQPKKFQQDETRETGSIKLAHYVTWFRNGGSLFWWACVSFAFCSYVVLHVSRSWWVNIWTRHSSTDVSHQHLDIMFHVSKLSPRSESERTVFFYLGIYMLLSVLTCVAGTMRYALLLMAAIRSSRNLFKKLTFAVLRAPLRWLDTVPVGRILNRFTSDFHMIDAKLPYDFSFMMYNVLQVVGIIAAGVLVSPLLLVFALLLLLVCLYFAHRFLAGAREVKRLESNAKSPVYEQYGSALIGLSTIRAFGKAQTYVERMYAKIDNHAQAYSNLWLFNRWMSFRMNMVGAVFSIITAALIVSLKGIDASLAGFALSFALQYNEAIAWALRQYASVELAMNATERVIEYSSIEIENQGGADAPAAWPTEGRLDVDNLVVGYAPDLPPVLRGLAFAVEKNQRVGVVGRTGAGKSSLTLALFRFLEAREGSIHIDGIDVSKIKLRDLRSRLAIIPQDPVLFSGTIRSNLDPFDEYTDAELRDALERVHLISSSTSPSSATATPPQTSSGPEPDSSSSTTLGNSANANTNIFTSLNSTISEGGLNLSQGQRQLLCLARAIVSRPKIMVLDEATSAVDMDTDTLIQRSIRSEFGRNSTTLLVIAHRLSTIADFDRILVMDAGKAVEFGSPRELLGIEGGVFRGLVSESGEREKLERVILGEGTDRE